MKFNAAVLCLKLFFSNTFFYKHELFNHTQADKALKVKYMLGIIQSRGLI